MDDDELIELINKRYDELRENGFMEDMDREKHENLMLSIAHDFREMEGRKRTFVMNPKKYALASWIYQQICLLLDNCNEKYEIHILKPRVFMTSISIVVLTESLDVSSCNIAPLKNIIPHIDWFTLHPGDGDRVRMSFDINDVYVEIGKDSEPILNNAGEES